ncbi:MAG: TolB family protein [Bryobacteraceae bacterium]
MREPRQLTFDNRGSGNPAWTPDGREIIYSSNRLGSNTLWRVAPGQTGEPKPLAGVGDGAFSPVISRAAPGRAPRLAFVSSRSDRSIWRVAVSSPPSKEGPTPFISSTRNELSPQFSPDGKRIAFTSDRSGSTEIWLSDSDGSHATPLTSFRGPITDLPRWSPDGRRIAFHSRPGGQAEIYVISAEGGKPQRLTDNPTDDVAPSWSRDGKWIYFGSNRTGEHQIWKMPAAGGAAVQVTKKGGLFALESPDGRFLYYTKVRGRTGLWKAAADGSEETQIAESIFYLSFTVELTGVYFLPEAGIDAGTSIQVMGFDGGAARKIAAVEKRPHTHISVSPDGRWILYAQSSPPESDLMLVENFH